PLLREREQGYSALTLTPINTITIAVTSNKPLPMNTPLAPLRSNTAPPPAAPALIASWMDATSSPPALSASSGTVVASQVDQPTGTRPKAKPHSATSNPSSI